LAVHTNIGFARQILVLTSRTKFHANPSSSFGDETCVRADNLQIIHLFYALQAMKMMLQI